MNSLSVILTSFHQRDLTINAIKSYLKFCPNDLDLTIIMVENSDDIRYRDEVKSMDDRVVWAQNNTHYRGANANANGIEVGMEYVKDDYVFLSHNDVCIREEFFNTMSQKVEEGNVLVGTCSDISPQRNFSIIVLGCLVKSEIVRSVNLYPLDKPNGSAHFEVGDRIHIYCKDNNLKHVCLDNTHNNPDLINRLPNLYQSFRGVKTVNDDGEIVFIHFARGTSKTMGSYDFKTKKDSLNIQQIIEFCDKNIL